jgi:Tol biopolymer transport system component
MTNRRFRAVFALISAIVIGAVVMASAKNEPQAASPEALLGRAQHQQDVDSNFTAAIATYKQVIASPKASRALVARALLLMGICYEQLGDADARRAYERIVKEFSDLGDTASAATVRLTNLDAASHTTSSALATRKIYDGLGLDWCNGLSSSARYLSYPDWDTGDIAVADLTTGHGRRVTTNGRINASPASFGECSIFSPDDKQIAFFWQTTDAGSELRVIGFDGTAMRTVYRDSDGKYLRPLDWSADGRSVVAELAKKNGRKVLAAISMSDGAMRVLKGDEGGISAAQFSPDGRFVAYSARISPDSTKQDVFVMAADGSAGTALISHPADDAFLGWAPGGATVFFASDRTGSYGVWSVGVSNGRPSGAPVLVKPDTGAITPVRLMNGTLYYAAQSTISDIYAAPIDPVTGRQQGPAAPVKSYSTGPDFAADWSPDGKFLAYRSIRSGAGDPLSAPALLSILTLETGKERQVHPALEALDFNDGPHWSADGRSLLVIARQMTPEHGIYRVDVETGATTLIVKAARDQSLLHALWGPGNQNVIYTIGNPARVVRHDMTTGQDTDLVSLPNSTAGYPRIALSPDGHSLAFTGRETTPAVRTTLNLISADGGPAHEVCCSGEAINTLKWTPDGRYLFFSRGSEFWRATPDGKTIEKINVDLKGRWFALSPDGRRIAYTSGQAKSELWALENLAPRKK